jgi:hypothetical protein
MGVQPILLHFGEKMIDQSNWQILSSEDQLTKVILLL